MGLVETNSLHVCRDAEEKLLIFGVKSEYCAVIKTSTFNNKKTKYGIGATKRVPSILLSE